MTVFQSHFSGSFCAKARGTRGDGVDFDMRGLSHRLPAAALPLCKQISPWKYWNERLLIIDLAAVVGTMWWNRFPKWPWNDVSYEPMLTGSSNHAMPYCSTCTFNQRLTTYPVLHFTIYRDDVHFCMRSSISLFFLFQKSDIVTLGRHCFILQKKRNVHKLCIW